MAYAWNSLCRPGHHLPLPPERWDKGVCRHPAQIALTHMPRDDIAHSGEGPPTSVINQGNAPQICPQAKLMEAILELRVPLSRCDKLTKICTPMPSEWKEGIQLTYKHVSSHTLLPLLPTIMLTRVSEQTYPNLTHASLSRATFSSNKSLRN